jgi:hypothetical protein
MPSGLPLSLSEEERRLLNDAADFVPAGDGAELSASNIAWLTAERGIDFATAVLYQCFLADARHGPFMRRIHTALASLLPLRPIRATLAIAPGAYYREFPAAGGDGRLLAAEAARHGCRAELIPTESTGTLAENGQRICEWLARRRAANPSERIILASLSKGGSDIKAALRRSEAREAFAGVAAWLNLSGVLSGSPMVAWLRARRLHHWITRLAFRLRGLSFVPIDELDRGPGTPLSGELRLPEHLLMISVVGFPLSAHLATRRTRAFHRRIAASGPNDGVIALADLCQQPGLIFPVWGADHYLRPGYELRHLAAALTHYVAEECSLWESPNEIATRAEVCA